MIAQTVNLICAGRYRRITSRAKCSLRNRLLAHSPKSMGNHHSGDQAGWEPHGSRPPAGMLRYVMARDVDRNAQLGLLTQVRERIQKVEADIIAQNETIATLERTGRDAREAKALRAQL
jgi:hypothetical protein